MDSLYMSLLQNHELFRIVVSVSSILELIFFYQYLNNWFAIPLIYGILKDFVNFLAEGGQINEDDLRSAENVRLYLATP